MYKITDDAGDVWDAYQGKGVPLYQVQTGHGTDNLFYNVCVLASAIVFHSPGSIIKHSARLRSR